MKMRGSFVSEAAANQEMKAWRESIENEAVAARLVRDLEVHTRERSRLRKEFKAFMRSMPCGSTLSMNTIQNRFWTKLNMYYTDLTMLKLLTIMRYVVQQLTKEKVQ